MLAPTRTLTDKAVHEMIGQASGAPLTGCAADGAGIGPAVDGWMLLMVLVVSKCSLTKAPTVEKGLGAVQGGADT